MTSTPLRMEHVVPLEKFGADDVAAVGGKAANLGELMRAGLPVPAGFTVTTHAYAVAAERAGLLSGPAGAPAPPVLRSAILAVGVPAEVRDAIAAAYLLLGEKVPVAVRSSATAEDLPGAAFAGQQDSYLNVVGVEAVVDAVRRCWASLWNDRAVSYRRDRGIEASGVRIAVVVQAMVESDAAGVMLTADPVTGARDRIIVDAASGLGEAVVSGLVTPDHYLLDRQGRLLAWTPGRAEVVIRSAPGGGVRQESDPARGPGSHAAPPSGRALKGRRGKGGAGPDGALLTPVALALLAEHARTITHHFGRPQDIEWAISEGFVWIVQARPMTALPPHSAPLNRAQRVQASILTEYLPVRPYPMDVTTSVARGPAKMMREIAQYYGIGGVFDDFLREEDGVAVQLAPASPRPTLRILGAPCKLVAKARRFHPANWSRDPRQVSFLAEIDALEAIDLVTLSWRDLCTIPDRALSAQDYCRDIRIDYLPRCALSFLRVFVILRLLGRQPLTADLLGGMPTRTEASNHALARLAGEVRADPDLHALIAGRDASDALTELSKSDRFAGFRAKLNSFLREFGRRETTSPLLVSSPTWVESPEIVLGLARSLADHPEPQSATASRSTKALQELLEHKLLRDRSHWQGRMRRWVKAAQEAVAFREDTHFNFTAPLPTLRRSILEIGARLQQAGLLQESAEVFHLRWEEIKGIENPRTLPPGRLASLRASIRQRTAKRAEMSGVPLIDPARVFPSRHPGGAIVTGTPAGSGTVTGVARVIRSPEGFASLRRGEILVCPYTNPAWTPLFERAAAVVVDTGAAASHAAIVAREYGIPAIMGTGTGTSAISDGETITVDGTLGRVTRAA